jgi:predicted TPR repeat methyltransferase
VLLLLLLLSATDISPFLASCTDDALDLVISADVWIYVGALEEVFELCARKLKPATGRMAFSIETLEQSDADGGAPFRLARSGRFQHTHRYIADLSRVNGLEIALSEDIEVRKESGQPIPGRIYVLERVASPSS